MEIGKHMKLIFALIPLLIISCKTVEAVSSFETIQLFLPQHSESFSFKQISFRQVKELTRESVKGSRYPKQYFYLGMAPTQPSSGYSLEMNVAIGKYVFCLREPNKKNKFAQSLGVPASVIITIDQISLRDVVYLGDCT